MLLAAIGWTQDITAWFLLRFLLGVAVLPLYILSEVWIIELAPPERRGRVLGFYTSVISAGFAIGPFSLILVGTEGWPPFIVGIGAFPVCGECLDRRTRPPPQEGRQEGENSVLSFLALAWMLLPAVVVAAVFEQTNLSLIPVYGTSQGIAEAEMSALIGACDCRQHRTPGAVRADRGTADSAYMLCCASPPQSAGLSSRAGRKFLDLAGHVRAGSRLIRGLHVALIELGDRFSGPMLSPATPHSP